MSRREKLSPGFSISHDIEEEFPSRHQRGKLGYSPFDLFLNSGIPEDPVLQPRFMAVGEEASDLAEPIEDDVYLVFRYKRPDFDINSSHGIPVGPDKLPVFQREFHPVTLRPDKDFHVLAEILEDSIEEVTESDYIYEANLTDIEGNTARCRSIGDYLHEISGGRLDILPSTYGIQDIVVNPRNFHAIIGQYSQEVEVYRDEGRDTRKETVRLNYDESEIDSIENALRSEGFQVTRDILPPEVYPQDI